MDHHPSNNSTLSEGKSPPGAVGPRITFENLFGQGRINQLGGMFINGRPLPPETRIQIVEMWRQGVKPCKISKELKVSHGAVSKILMRFNETGSISPGQIGGCNPRSRISIQAVRPHILRICEEKPGIDAIGVQQTLVKRGICSRHNVPNATRICRLLKAQKQRNLMGNYKSAAGTRANRNGGEIRSENEAFGTCQNAIGTGTIGGPKLAPNGDGGNGGGGRPLSHSIENILSGGQTTTSMGNILCKGTEGGIGSSSISSSSVPEQLDFPSSSASSSTSSLKSASNSSNPVVFTSSLGGGSNSDEENQQQQQQKPSTSSSSFVGDGEEMLLLKGSRRARTSFGQEQLRLLEQTFRQNPYPGQELKESLIKATQLDEDKIITWFSNRRARSRRKALQHFSPYQQLWMQNNSNNAIGQKMKDEKPSPITVGNGILAHSSVKPIIPLDGSADVLTSEMANVAQQQQHNVHLQHSPFGLIGQPAGLFPTGFLPPPLLLPPQYPMFPNIFAPVGPFGFIAHPENL